jgi:hypothetical protein
MIRRINFFAGPGAGKSTIAARTFAELKVRGYDVEHVPEYIKTWAYEGKKPISYDQAYVFVKQLHAEDVILRHVDHIVTDSPLLMNNAYSKFYGCKYAENMVAISQAFDRDFPSLNFYIDCTVEYVESGRYQSYEQAVEFDWFLKDFLACNLEGSLIHVRVEDFHVILDIIEANLNEQGSGKNGQVA